MKQMGCLGVEMPDGTRSRTPKAIWRIIDSDGVSDGLSDDTTDLKDLPMGFDSIPDGLSEGSTDFEGILDG
eukprot:CAMPEP_0116866188 /NCGR_PEP_ID=MMETSP0418-20121206/25888_1 /TAXON_ID=1158023 /ORGANISM="Astrosyne radiata, Strain 13vi08-1A" /LENGTH=70 /DNA_ID=CAMNT_0004501791 /DNA_START=1306 /DNA_END=1515 /DNA_ORIENTATION=-